MISHELRARVALEEHGFRVTHALGQNFLLSEELLLSMLEEIGLSAGDRVLEIGPGPGLMTVLIAEKAKSILSIELDEKLRPVLGKVLEGHGNARVVFADAMKADLRKLTEESFGSDPFRVIANLPYYITTDAVLKLLTAGLPVTEISLTLQKEAAERLCAPEGSAGWCAAAAVVRYYAFAEILRTIPRECFEPSPHVDSVLLRIVPWREKPVQAGDDGMMRRVIACAFRMRRKKLTNNLKADFGIGNEEACLLLDEIGVDRNIRGEALSVEQLGRLADVLTLRVGK